MTPICSSQATRRKAVWGPRRQFVAALFCLFAFAPGAVAAGRSGAVGTSQAGKPNSNVVHQKMDQTLTKRANGLSAGTSKVIVTFKPGYKLPGAFKAYAKKNVGIINGSVVEVPNRLLKQLANHPAVLDLHIDRPLHKDNYRTGLTTGARAVQSALGFTGYGIGVAVIDSGITTWHDDLTNRSTHLYPYGDQRVSAFVDLVNGQVAPYDDDGHGSHVAGVIAGNGYDSNGLKSGSAPDASLAVLKVLDVNGQGTVSNLIAALDWVLANHTQYNIRVVNLSVGAGVTESYWTDPLTLAAKRVVDAGVVVVAAAGKAGKNAAGAPQYGGIAAPGNAPWVLTVGASSTVGTANRFDDTMAGFSSRGPTYLDWTAKPDVVAPGVSTYSLAVPGSTLFNLHPNALLSGSIVTAQPPYLALSGTSMSAPVVSGVVAQMLQANPTLTPNAVKAILQYTAENRADYNALTEGAGFLNAVGAVRLASFYATALPGASLPLQAMWSKQIIWGNYRLAHGVLDPSANAFAMGTNWGVAFADDGDNIVWGTACGASDCDNIVWGTSDTGDNIVWGTSDTGDNIVWGTSDTGDNIVWGTACADATCDNIVWGTADDGDNIVWGTDCGGSDCDNIVWGTADGGDNIVWGTADEGDNIVWGTACADATCDNIVWGVSDDGDNIVWGVADEGDNIVWGTADEGDNIVWGTADEGDNIVWGTADEGDNIVWGTYTVVDAAGITTVIQVLKLLNLDGLTDEQIFLALSGQSAPPPPPPLDLAVATIDTTYDLSALEPVAVDTTYSTYDAFIAFIVLDPMVVTTDTNTVVALTPTTTENTSTTSTDTTLQMAGF